MRMGEKKYYIGVDVGSISTNVAVIDDERNIVETAYIRTEGKPIASVQKSIQIIKNKLKDRYIQIHASNANKPQGVIRTLSKKVL